MLRACACVRQARHGVARLAIPLGSSLRIGSGAPKTFLRTFSDVAPTPVSEEQAPPTPAAAPTNKAFAKLDNFIGGGKLPKMRKTTDRTYDGIDLEKQNLLGSAILDTEGMDEAELLDMERATNLLTASAAELQTIKVGNIVEKYQRFEGDTGSTEVQVAVVSLRIQHMEEHMAKHRKDFGTKRRLQILSDRRRKLMKYLKGERFSKYELMLRDFGITEEHIWEHQRLPKRKFFASRMHGINEWKGDDARRAKRAEMLAAMAPAKEEVQQKKSTGPKKRQTKKSSKEKRALQYQI